MHFLIFLFIFSNSAPRRRLVEISNLEEARRCTEPKDFLWWATLSDECQANLPIFRAWTLEEGCSCINTNGVAPTCKFDSSHSTTALEFQSQCDAARTSTQAVTSSAITTMAVTSSAITTSSALPATSAATSTSPMVPSTLSATSAASTSTAAIVLPTEVQSHPTTLTQTREDISGGDASTANIILPAEPKSQPSKLAHVRKDIPKNEEVQSSLDPIEPCVAVKQCEQCRCSKNSLAIDHLSLQDCIYLSKSQNLQYFAYRDNPPRCETTTGMSAKECNAERRTSKDKEWNVYRVTCTSMSDLLPHAQAVEIKSEDSLAVCNSQERKRVASDCHSMLEGSRQNRYDRDICQCLNTGALGAMPNCFWDLPSEKTVVEYFNHFCTKTARADPPSFSQSGFSQPVQKDNIHPPHHQEVSTVDRVIYIFSFIGLLALAYYAFQCYRRYKLRQQLQYEQVEIADSNKSKKGHGYHTEKTAITKEPPDHRQIYY